MKKLFSTVAILATAALAFNAQAVEFVGNEGSGDLSVDSNWNGGAKPTASQEAKFTRGGTLTAGEAFSASSMTFNGERQIWTLLDAVVNLSGTATTSMSVGYGGKTDKRAGNILEIGSGANVQISGGGAVVGGASAALTTGSSGGSILRIKDGGRLWVAKGLSLGNSYSPSNRIEVAKGGVLDVTYPKATAVSVGFGNSSEGNVVDLYGTCVATQNYNHVYVGNGVAASNNLFRCHSGSYFETKGNVFIGSSGSGNRLIVEDGATVKQSNNNNRKVVVGEKAGACSNSIEIVGCQNVSFAVRMTVGSEGSYNRADFHNGPRIFLTTIGEKAGACHNEYRVYGDNVIDNANLDNVVFGNGSDNVFRIEGVTVTNATANFAIAGSNNKIVIGTNTVLATQGQIIFGTGRENEVVVDHAKWDHYVTSHARASMDSNDRLTIKNGSTVNFLKDSFKFGDVAGACNLLKVQSGSMVTFGDFRLTKDGNELAVSNATVKMIANSITKDIKLPYYNTSWILDSTNNVFRFEGDSPLLCSDGGFTFLSHWDGDTLVNGNTFFEFAVPEKPYTAAPISATFLVLPVTTKIRATVASKSANRRTYVLAQTTTGVISVADMDELGSELPANCKLKLSEDKKTLSLVVRGDGGLILMVR